MAIIYQNPISTSAIYGKEIIIMPTKYTVLKRESKKTTKCSSTIYKNNNFSHSIIEAHNSLGFTNAHLPAASKLQNLKPLLKHPRM